MEDHRDAEPNTEFDNTPPAPGELEMVRGFMSLHDHVPVTEDSLPPTGATIAWWLRDQGLLDPSADASDKDLAWSADVLEALRARVFENMGAEPDPATIATLDAAAADVGLAPRFGAEGLVPRADGVRGAVGQSSRSRSWPSSTARGPGSRSAATRRVAPSSTTDRRTAPASGA